MIRSSVDFPAPLTPSTPILALGKKESEISFSTCRPPAKVLVRSRMT